MTKIIDKVQQAKIATDIKLLAPPTKQEQHVLTEETKTYQEKLEGFGINNTTAKALQKVKQVNNNIKLKNAAAEEKHKEQHGLTLITQMFAPFAVVSYAVMHQIAVEYNLIISALSYYNNPIEEDNLDEMEAFRQHMVELAKKSVLSEEKIPNQKRHESHRNYEEKIAKLQDPFKGQVTFPHHKDFIFDEDAHSKFLHSLDFTTSLNIVAPESHFDFKGQNVVACGREVKPYAKKPSFKYEFKVNKPEPKDPIVVLPFKYMKQLYFIVVTSWDKVADDSRIRTQLPISI